MSIQLDSNSNSAPILEAPRQTTDDLFRTATDAGSGSAPAAAPTSRADGAVVEDWDPASGDAGESIGDRVLDLLTELLEPLGQEILDYAKEKLFGDDTAATSGAPGTSEAASGSSAPSAGTVTSLGDFESEIRGILKPDAQGDVHEEELFAAVASYLVGKQGGAEASERFLQVLQEKIATPGASVEGAAIEALQTIVDEGLIPAETGDAIYAQAFASAQLDDDAEALFDGRGSEGDPTIAKAPLDEALESARAKLEAFAAGTEEATPRSLADARPTGGKTAELGDGFLFKPRSEGDGNLVVLLPETLTGGVVGIELTDEDGDIIEAGDATGVANGGREHFRFDRPGGDYPAGVTVRVTLESGEVITRKIDDPSRREEG